MYVQCSIVILPSMHSYCLIRDLPLCIIFMFDTVALAVVLVAIHGSQRASPVVVGSRYMRGDRRGVGINESPKNTVSQTEGM